MGKDEQQWTTMTNDEQGDDKGKRAPEDDGMDQNEEACKHNQKRNQAGMEH